MSPRMGATAQIEFPTQQSLIRQQCSEYFAWTLPLRTPCAAPSARLLPRQGAWGSLGGWSASWPSCWPPCLALPLPAQQQQRLRRSQHATVLLHWLCALPPSPSHQMHLQEVSTLEMVPAVWNDSRHAPDCRIILQGKCGCPVAEWKDLLAFERIKQECNARRAARLECRLRYAGSSAMVN